MHDGSYAAIGFAKLGDLSSVALGDQVKETVRHILEEKYPGDPKYLSRKAGEIRDFIARMEDGEVVVAADGQQILGVGRADGPYQFEETEPVEAPHRRLVKWISTDEWKLPKSSEGMQATFFPLGKFPENIVEIERRLLEEDDNAPAPKPSAVVGSRVQRLGGIPGRIQAILERKGQAILFGPPGTGKTHWARLAAHDLAAISAFGRLSVELTSGEREIVEGAGKTAGLVRWCTFHPAYGYEDFIEGFRPKESAAKQLVFERSSGIFKKLCDDARNAPNQKFFLVVDEINRGDIPRASARATYGKSNIPAAGASRRTPGAFSPTIATTSLPRWPVGWACRRRPRFRCLTISSRHCSLLTNVRCVQRLR